MKIVQHGHTENMKLVGLRPLFTVLSTAIYLWKVGSLVRALVHVSVAWKGGLERTHNYPDINNAVFGLKTTHGRWQNSRDWPL